MMKRNRILGRLPAAAVAAAFLAISAHAPAILLGQLDDFQDGTVMGWGGGANPENVPTGGPGGAGDKFLRLTSTGGAFGPGSRIGTFNSLQWGGNYLSAGVTAVEMDLKNLGTVPLEMRVVAFGPLFSRWTSLVAYPLPADGQWHRAVFILKESEMVLVQGDETFSATMGGVPQLLIRHQAGPPHSQGTSIATQMGIDNVHAINQIVALPNNFSITMGSPAGGNLQSLFANDMNYVSISADELDPAPQVEIFGTVPAGQPAILRFLYDAGSSRTDMVETLELWNFQTGNWDPTTFNRTPTLGDSTVLNSIATNPSRLIQFGTRAVRSRLTWFPTVETTEFDGWGIRLDQFNWIYVP